MCNITFCCLQKYLQAPQMGGDCFCLLVSPQKQLQSAERGSRAVTPLPPLLQRPLPFAFLSVSLVGRRAMQWRCNVPSLTPSAKFLQMFQ